MNTRETVTDFVNHPIQGLLRAFAHNNIKVVLEFSRYIHLGHGRTLSRDIFHVEAHNLDTKWLVNQIESLSREEELALHSKVLQQGQTYHIPMVDFVHVKSTEGLVDKMLPVSRLLSTDITFYDSGQSMHGYYFCLIGERNWYEYLGRLLLCNSPLAADEQVVDSRWVGHSLEHGFSASRWSCNSGIYGGLPQLVNVTGNYESKYRTVQAMTSFQVFHTD
jgi:hypothetical protein